MLGFKAFLQCISATRMSQRKRQHLKSPQSLTVSSALRSPRKFKVKSTPVSAASWPLISLVFHIRASFRLPSLSFHDNRASHSWDTIWPCKFKVNGQVQRYPSQRSIQLTHFLSVSHQGILSTPVPFVPRPLGLPFPRYNLTLKIQGQRSRSKVKVKGTLVNIASSWLISCLLHINWTNYSWDITGRLRFRTRAGSQIKTKNFKRRLLPHHISQRCDIWCTNSPIMSCFNPKFVDRSVPHEAKQRHVKFRRCFGNIPLAAGNVSVTRIASSGTEPKVPVTEYRNRGSANHTRG